jgi:hypothetical protein
MVSGAPSSAYWAANLAWDALSFLLPAGGIVALVWLYNQPQLAGVRLGALAVLLVAFGGAGITLTYLAHFAFTVGVCVGARGGPAGCMCTCGGQAGCTCTCTCTCTCMYMWALRETEAHGVAHSPSPLAPPPPPPTHTHTNTLHPHRTRCARCSA